MVHMLKIAAVALVVIASACTGTWGAPGHSRSTHRALVAGYVASTALQSCDVGQTVWASHGGRWDRASRPGYKMAEMNPILGHEPDPKALVGVAVANAIVGYVMLEAPIPAWIKGAWYSALATTEAVIVAGNYRFTGACGLADTHFAGYDQSARE
jgi:hypothetical protein